jgi:predicted dehydrogenase
VKQIIQSYKTGELGIFEVPPPVCRSNGILIATTASLISAGTERMIVDFANKSLFGKAKSQPELVKQVINKMRHEGIKNTIAKVMAKLDAPVPLGYSCAGRVIEAGADMSGISIGDRVACGGAGYANHSEINYIPKNLFVKIPGNVEDVEAAFVTVGAIALQGVRQAEPAIGEKVAVIGLGLIGQLTVQILKANGCKVLGVDPQEGRLRLAKELGADMVCGGDEIIQTALQFSSGYGVDGIIITASTDSDQPVIDAGEIARHKGRVVVVGMVGMDIPRNLYYKKELELKLSMAYGAGRHDPVYEERGIDYPYAHVRWTEQRNFEAFLDLVAGGKVTPKRLITHRFDFEDSLKAYEMLGGKIKEDYLGIILSYKDGTGKDGTGNAADRIIKVSGKTAKADTVHIGMIGAGNFARSLIMPALNKLKGFEPVGICTATGVSAHAAGKKLGFKYITTDSDEIFGHPEINAVIITTRHNTHAEFVIKALKGGKHVFVEKPLCIKETELEEIKDFYLSLAARRSLPPLLMVGFNRRFAPLIVRMKEIAKDMPMAVTYRVNAGAVSMDAWVQDMETGGGRIIGEVCHFIDACSFLTGSEPVSVYAGCVRKDDKSMPDEDNASILIKYRNGSTATINYLSYGSRQVPKEYIELFSNDITIQMNDFRDLLVYKGNKTERVRNANQDKGFVNELTAFRNAINNGIAPVPFEAYYNTTRTTFRILDSLRQNKHMLL